MIRKLLAAAMLAGVCAAPAGAQIPDFGIRHFADTFGSILRTQVQPSSQTATSIRRTTDAVMMRTQFQPNSDVVARTFGAALQRSRDAARADAQPVPARIRAALSPFYSDADLDNVRFKVGDTSAGGLAGFAIRNGNAAAVTLIDTIVFKEERFIDDIGLWAHEMRHIEQFREWGVTGFAARYAFGWNTVEAEAEAKSRDFMAWYRDRPDRPH
jgi:hypothetical protein